MIVVDTTFLVLMIDPRSTQNTNRRADKVAHFVEALSKQRTEVIIPAPAVTELVAARVDRVEELVETVRSLRSVSVQPFDSVIAIETGELIAQVQAQLPAADRAPRWKVAMKYDAMIAATAIVRGASALYTADADFGQYLKGSKVQLKMVDDLPDPPEDPQITIPF